MNLTLGGLERVGAISERGVIGVMDTLVQRGKFQKAGMCCEHWRDDGSLPLVVGAASVAMLASNRLEYLQDTAHKRQYVFEALMEAVKTHSLGQISHALYDVGGEYRRNM